MRTLKQTNEFYTNKEDKVAHYLCEQVDGYKWRNISFGSRYYYRIKAKEYIKEISGI